MFKEPKKIYIEPCSHQSIDEISIDFVTPIEKKIVVPVRNESLDLAIVDILANLTTKNESLEIHPRLTDLREHVDFKANYTVHADNTEYHNITIGGQDIVIADGETFGPGHNATNITHEKVEISHSDNEIEFNVTDQ